MKKEISKRLLPLQISTTEEVQLENVFFLTSASWICLFFDPIFSKCICPIRGVFSFLKPGWLGSENVLQVKHFDACTLYFLKNHPNHPGNYTSVLK